MIKLGNINQTIETQSDNGLSKANVTDWQTNAIRYIYVCLRSRNVPHYVLGDRDHAGLVEDIASEAKVIQLASQTRKGLSYKRKGETHTVRQLTLKQSCRFAISRVLKAAKTQYKIVHDYTDTTAGQDVKKHNYIMHYASITQYKNIRKAGYIKNYDMHKGDIARCLGERFNTLIQGIIDGRTRIEIAAELGIPHQRISDMERELKQWAKIDD